MGNSDGSSVHRQRNEAPTSPAASVLAEEIQRSVVDPETLGLSVEEICPIATFNWDSRNCVLTAARAKRARGIDIPPRRRHLRESHVSRNHLSGAEFDTCRNRCNPPFTVIEG